MIKELKNAIVETLLAFNPTRAQLESMMKMDFKMGDQRTNQMQLCFANLAAWPLVFMAAILYWDPTRFSWSLQKVLTDYQGAAFFLLDGRLANMVLFFLVLFFVQWILRAELFMIMVVFYFLLKSDIHLYLGVASVLGIMISRSCYLWWMHKDIKSKSYDIWKKYSSLQIISTILSGLLSLYLLHVFAMSGYFSGTYSANRIEFLWYLVVLNYLLPMLAAAVWGHFYFKEKAIEPSNFPIHYSTANWILRFKIRPYFKKQLGQQVQKYLTLHQNNLIDLKAIKDLGPASIPAKISEIIKTELGYLQLASSRLTIE